jgi:hypothetical protein
MGDEQATKFLELALADDCRLSAIVQLGHALAQRLGIRWTGQPPISTN